MYIFGLFSLFVMVKRLNIHRNICSLTNILNNELDYMNESFPLLNKKKIKRIMKKQTEGGYDERYSKNISYDNDAFTSNFSYDEEKLNIFSAKVNILKKLTSNNVSQTDKLKTVNELKYFSDSSSEYITNINANDLYNKWLLDW